MVQQRSADLKRVVNSSRLDYSLLTVSFGKARVKVDAVTLKMARQKEWLYPSCLLEAQKWSFRKMIVSFEGKGRFGRKGNGLYLEARPSQLQVAR